MADLQRIKPILDPYLYFTHSRALRLLDLFAELRPTRLLEIGSGNGAGTCYLAELCKEYGGHVTTVDVPRKKDPPWIKAKPEQLLRQCGLTNATVLRLGGGGGEFLSKCLRDGREFDFIYEDDGHTLGTVPAHFALGFACLRPGGYIVFDDLAPGPWPDVQLTWDKIVVPMVARTYKIANWGFAMKPLAPVGTAGKPPQT